MLTSDISIQPNTSDRAYHDRFHVGTSLVTVESQLASKHIHHNVSDSEYPVIVLQSTFIHISIHPDVSLEAYPQVFIAH